MATDVMSGVVSGGTATAARFPDGRPAAGKTGTTSDYSDAWFAGYVPQLATAVWMGSPEGNVPMRNVGGIRVTGLLPGADLAGVHGPGSGRRAHRGVPACASFRSGGVPPPTRRGVGAAAQ